MDYEKEQITFEIKEHIGVLCISYGMEKGAQPCFVER